MERGTRQQRNDALRQVLPRNQPPCRARTVEEALRLARETCRVFSSKLIATYVSMLGIASSCVISPVMERPLEPRRVERRVTAILAADVVGYSRLIGADDEGTLAQLKAHHNELIGPKISEYRGRIVRTTGDGLLVLFASVVDALRCAIDVQRGMVKRNAQVPREARIEFRIGVNFGDIIIDDGSSIHGDGVNVAARLEALAEPGGICISGRVQEDAQGRFDIAFEDAGEQQLKNIAHPVRIFVGQAPTKFDEKTLELKDEITKKLVAQQLAGFAKFIERVKA
jgi:class 3 adenylate cyclase